jgi:CarboxypepD_reg-like domain
MQHLAKIITTLFLLLTTPVLWAQPITQTIKGTVLDKSIKSPLIGASVVLLSTQPLRGATADDNGFFKITGIPVGKHTLKISYVGYKDVVLNNIVVNSGKELELNIDMEEQVVQAQEVVIRAKIEQQKALNELSVVSTKTFAVEQTQRFAAAFNDPGRMATAYAGVVGSNDGNNTIVIRGNSPNGLLWRMEGVDIPNPNHFSSVGTSGGGISILSAQVLTNSDFSTGAFAVEYGNALSGVFDLKLRRGNTEKREYTIQAGLVGLDLAAEGPLSTRHKKGSYLINYRYSTLGLLQNMGLNIGDASTKFQDLSFNIAMPTEKLGNFTVFGFGGLSDQLGKSVADSLLWQQDSNKRYGWNLTANTGAIGMTHSLIFDKSYLKTVVIASGTSNLFDANELLSDYSRRTLNSENHKNIKYTLSSVYNHKFNAKHLLRAGGYANWLQFNYYQNNWDIEQQESTVQIDNQGGTASTNLFAQWQYRPTEALTFNTGFHHHYLHLNKKSAIEPRFSAKYAFSERQSISVGYGLHSQLQPMGIYFYDDEATTQRLPNQHLDFTKAQHFIIAFDQMLAGNWHIKTEAYYQYLYDVPVSTGLNGTQSLLNVAEGYSSGVYLNQGKGRNMGIELTVEQFLTNGFYLLWSSSIYDSKYQALNGQWYNTRFNSHVANSFLMGKEWDFSKKNRSLALNLKLTHVGGLFSTPVDVVASQQNGETVFDQTRPFSHRLPYYLRADVGIRLKRNYARITTTLALDIQNVTNRSNVFNQYYSPETQTVKYNYQAPLIPILSYKIEF